MRAANFWPHLVLLSALCWSWACTSAPERQARQVEEDTYRIALERLVKGHVYDMSCQALLPLAADLLWEADYDGIEYGQAQLTLVTAWVDREPTLRTRQVVHSHRAGHQRCAVQIFTELRTDQSTDQRRDVAMEMALLERIDPRHTQYLRQQARQEARRAYKLGLERFQQQESSP